MSARAVVVELWQSLPPSMRLTAKRGLTWWWRELDDALPGRLRTLLQAARRPVPVLDLSRHWVRLNLGTETLTGELSLTSQEIDETERQQLIALRDARLNAGKLVVRLQKPLILERDITLPLAAEASLPAIIRHQIPKLVPLSHEDVATSHSIVSRDATTKTLCVRVTMAKHTSLQRARQLADDLGLSCTRIVAAHRSGERKGFGPNLWSAETQSTAERRRARLHRALEAAAVCLFVMAYTLHVARTDSVRGELSREVARERLEAADVRALAAKVARERAALSYLVARRGSVPPLVVLGNLTRQIPLDSWVSDFTWQHGSVQITGASRDADALIGRLEASSMFEAPHFTAATTLSPAGDGQRFEMAFSVGRERQ